MQDEIVSFLKKPEAGTYVAMRTAVTARYHPEHPGEADLWQMLESADARQCDEHVARVMPDMVLSPSFHLAIARVAEKGGDKQRADMENYFAVKLREQLLASGDGSLAKPYVVTRVEEEYTILAALEKQIKDLSMAFVEGRWLDVVRTRDGKDYHFDVSIPVKAYGRS